MAENKRTRHQFINLKTLERNDMTIFLTEFKNHVDNSILLKISQVIYGALILHQYIDSNQIVIFSYVKYDDKSIKNCVVYQLSSLSDEAEKMNSDKEYTVEIVKQFLQDAKNQKEVQVYTALYPETEDGKIKISLVSPPPNVEYLDYLYKIYDHKPLDDNTDLPKVDLVPNKQEPDDLSDSTVILDGKTLSSI